MFNQIGIKSKLFFSFFFTALIALTVGGVSYSYSSRVIRSYRSIAKDNVPKFRLFSDINTTQTQIVIPVAALAGSNSTPEDALKGKSEISKVLDRFEKLAKEYESLGFGAGEEALWKDYKKNSWQPFVDLSFEMARLSGTKNKADQQTRDKMWEKEYANSRKSRREAFNKLVDWQVSDASTKETNGDQLNDRMNRVIFSIVVAGFFFALLTGFIISKNLERALNSVTNSLAQGSQEVNSASSQLSSASQQVSSGSTESAASLQETVASVEEISSMVRHNSDNAKQAAVLAQKTYQSAETGESEIKKLIQAMTDISLGSKKIEEIINVIDDIAFQINLLALNASVEAARAGEQGRGFAVVADAVRNLAQRSASAAKDINSLIKESVEKIGQGSSIADKSEGVLHDIVTSIKTVSDLNGEIASASSEQASGILQISKALTELDTASQRNASASEEVAASAEEMSSQSQMMLSLVDQLRAVIDGESQQLQLPSESLAAETPALKLAS